MSLIYFILGIIVGLVNASLVQNKTKLKAEFKKLLKEQAKIVDMSPDVDLGENE